MRASRPEIQRMARLFRLLACLLLAACGAAQAQCPATVPAAGAPPPGPLPLFPADNWWNLDIRSAPVDTNSAAYINFINNGGTRKLHPDFGGEASPGSVSVYGFPYAVVNGSQPKLAVQFQYADESDGVDHNTGQALPFYPIPAEAVTQPHWVEGGAPGNVDQRNSGDRHLLIVDCTNRHLYELYNVYYSASQGWLGGSGAFFDLDTNGRRPDGWTSADAAGLAIFPGLVRYDDAWNPAVSDIGHAFRVTVRSTNGYVWPASHRAGSTAGALPMGARLRLKASVNGQDPALRTPNPNLQKIFRAMQKYGLIVADNGSDMYISGTFDTRWDNDILNPGFALLSASDFEVVQLGWKPVGGAPALASLGASPNPVTGGSTATGSVALTAAAPSGGALVALTSSNPSLAPVPSSVTVAQGATQATFAIPTSSVVAPASATIGASYAGVTKTTTLTVNPVAAAALASLSVTPSSVVGGTSATGTVTLTAAAPAGGSVVTLTSSDPGVASTPASVTVAAGASSANFTVATTRPRRATAVTLSARAGTVTKTATLTVTRR
jgi:hypothetical protein